LTGAADRLAAMIETATSPAAGGRPNSQPAHPDYERMAAAIHWIRDHYALQPSVDDMAAAAGLSSSRFARIFRAWAGVTPGQYLRVVTLAHAKSHLAAGLPVLDAALESGLSSAGRIHDLFVDLEAVTPGDFGRRGAGLVIRHGRQATPFGDARIGVTDRGVCFWAFLDGSSPDAGVAQLRQRWPGARLEAAPEAAAAVVETAFGDAHRDRTLRVAVRGTHFQLTVWRALLQISPGAVTSYGELARQIGQPGASRAVGTAIGSNPVAWLIPCHRVLRADGTLGGYRWGPGRKQTMLDWESLRRTTGAHGEPSGAAGII
jgi:AraC family transcriptional regulator of adaptative response/methylated-DNA-[protein]-cysteine methyltransferase